jgi:hypothetical protein
LIIDLPTDERLNVEILGILPPFSRSKDWKSSTNNSRQKLQKDWQRFREEEALTVCWLL